MCSHDETHAGSVMCAVKEAGAQSYTPASSRGPVNVESAGDLVSSDSLAQEDHIEAFIHKYISKTSSNEKRSERFLEFVPS